MLKFNNNIVRFIRYLQVFITTSLCFMVSGWFKEWLFEEKVTSMVMFIDNYDLSRLNSMHNKGFLVQYWTFLLVKFPEQIETLILMY
jgi:hypothetical protein